MEQSQRQIYGKLAIDRTSDESRKHNKHRELESNRSERPEADPTICKQISNASMSYPKHAQKALRITYQVTNHAYKLIPSSKRHIIPQNYGRYTKSKTQTYELYEKR